jgi:SPP1 family predicted phage head-tail adaptor
MSVLSAGQLNHRIRIQQPTTVKDSLGAPTQVWTDVATVWADIQPLSGREARIADRVSAELTHQITVRHCPDLDDPQAVSRMRVLFRGRTFSIHAALNDDEANVSVILLASEGIRDG